MLSTQYISTTFKYLLDEYPGAYAAYSFRKLRSAYTGPCIRIRRSSDNAELDIGFVNNYVDVSAISSFVGSFSAWVVKRYDQGLNGWDIFNGTAARQPVVVNLGAVQTYNGYLYVNYDGVAHMLGCSSTDAFRNTPQGSIYQVLAWKTIPATFKINFTVNEVTTTGVRANLGGGNVANKHSAGGRRLPADVYQVVNSAASIVANQPYLQSALFDFQNADLFQYINGSVDGSTLAFQTAGNTSNVQSNNFTEGAYDNAGVPLVPAPINSFELVLYPTISITDVNANIISYYNSIL